MINSERIENAKCILIDYQSKKEELTRTHNSSVDIQKLAREELGLTPGDLFSAMLIVGYEENEEVKRKRERARVKILKLIESGTDPRSLLKI